MEYLWAILLVVVNLLWLALVLFGLPGNWLMAVSTVLVAWANWDRGMFSVWTLVAIFVLAAAGEVLEFVAGFAGSKRAGGSRRGAWGALAGGIAGAIVGTFLVPIPALGTLIGACGGACLGAWGMELSAGRGQGAAIRSGLGAGVGRLLGTLGKLAIGLMIWGIVAIAAFWP